MLNYSFRILILFFLFRFSSACAQEPGPIDLDRPDQTESAQTVPKKHLQAENGFLYEQLKGDIQSATYPSSLIKYGVTDNFEIGMIAELTSVDFGNNKISGFNPLTVRMKTSFFEEKGILPTTSFIGFLTIPDLATEEFKVSYYAPAFRFCMKNTLSEKLTLGYNLGAEWDGNSPEPVFIYTLALGFSLFEKTGGYVEVYGYSPQKSKADHRIDGGLTYLLRNNIMFDISGGTGIVNSELEYYASLGFSFRLSD